MNPERWRRVDEIFHNALAREPQDRPSFLEHACGGDSSLRHDVEDLLAAHQQANSFLQGKEQLLPSGGIAPGKKLGRYEIQGLIGVGGMGEVYLAQDTELDRKVALKFLPEFLQRDETLESAFLEKPSPLLRWIIPTFAISTKSEKRKAGSSSRWSMYAGRR
jgi:serine/threonine-protein kinase